MGGLLAFCILFVTGDGLAQDAAEILQTALEKYEERVAGIDDYTVTYSVMGREVSSHLRKEMVGGHPVFVAVDEDEGASAQRDWDPYRALPQLSARAEIVGRETIDGVQAHGLRVEDFEGLDIGMPADVQGEFEPRTLTLWIDTGEHLLRRMDLEGILVADGEERPLEISAQMLDYRTVEGMPHPFRTAIQIKGAMVAGGPSDEEAAEASEKLAELDRQMAEMPASQREMMEKMMGTQLEQLRKMVQSGAFEIELVVTDLKVNTGPPASSGG
jgi:hypothetical protein